MYCEACGSLVQEGGLACPTCGAELRAMRSRDTAPSSRPVAVAEELPGPKCETHPGMPLLGHCPRCNRPVCVRCAPGAVNDVLTCVDCAPLTVSHQRSPTGALCAIHPGTAATFVCSRCGAFACNGCLATTRGAEGLCVRCAIPSAPLATRGSRFVANLIDNMLVLGLAGGGAVVAGVLSSTAGKHLVNEALFIPVAFLGLLAGTAAQIIAQVTWGQSLGKRLLSIKVVRLGGQPIELWRLLILRNLIVHVIAQACGIFGLVDALLIFGDEQRCLHDLFADSKVIAVDGRE